MSRAAFSARYPCPVTSRFSNESFIRRTRWLAVGLAAAAGGWVLVNGPVEGPVLLVLTPSHGITVADLPSIVALVIAGLLFCHSESISRNARRDQPSRSH